MKKVWFIIFAILLIAISTSEAWDDGWSSGGVETSTAIILRDNATTLTENTGRIVNNIIDATNATYGINENSTNSQSIRTTGNIITGAGTSSYKSRGRTSYDVYSYSTATATSGTGEDTLVTLTHRVPAQHILIVKSSGVKAGTNGNKTLKFYYGTSSVTFHAAANDTNDWQFEATIIQTAAAVQKIYWKGWNGTTMAAGYEDWTEDTSASFVVKVTGACANDGDSITLQSFVLERKYE